MHHWCHTQGQGHSWRALVALSSVTKALVGTDGRALAAQGQLQETLSEKTKTGEEKIFGARLLAGVHDRHTLMNLPKFCVWQGGGGREM